MAIATFTELKSAIGDWLNRDDLTAVVPSFIALAEARINRELRHYDMETRSTASLTGRYLALPTDWLQTIRVHLTAQGQPDLELVSQNDMAQMRGNSNDTSGRPRYFAVTAGELEVFPTPDETYEIEIVYFAKVEALSDSNASNWLLSRYPDVYLYGALVHSAPYLSDDPRAQTWAALYQSAIDAANAESRAAKFSGSGLRMLIRSY